MTQKELAIQCLEKLGIYKPYIRKFKSKQTMPCFFENFGGFWADQEETLWIKIKAIQDEYGCLVYAVTHERTELGDTWSMLCIPKDHGSVNYYVNETITGHFYAYAYVWNQTTPYFSEFGDVVVKSFGGGIKRIG